MVLGRKMQKQKLILVGGGGHCKACIDVIEQTDQYEILGILDQKINVGKSVLGYKIIGTDDELETFLEEDIQFLITIGQIKTTAVRVRIYEALKRCEAKLATIISPGAYVSKHAFLQPGTIVMHGVTINAEVKIGSNCILNTGCVIEHDSIIGEHCHISTNAVINGGCVVGKGVFIGSNATVANHLNIIDSVVIGAGAVIIKDLDQTGIYVGNPLQKIN